jgi:hypothetical protein
LIEPTNPTGSKDMDTETTVPPTDVVARIIASRRRFLMGSAGVAGALVLAACGSDDDEGGSGDTTTTAGDDTTTAGDDTTTTAGDDTTTTAGGGDASGDLLVGAFAASLEVLAVNTYTAAGKAATDGALGEVPPAVGEFVTTALEHHQAALDEWNGVLEAAGEQAVDAPPADLEKTVNDKFAEVTDVAGAAMLALELEQIAAATYLAAIPELMSKDAIGLAGSIQPIDMQHVAVLLFALGQYPVPDTFASTEMAAMPS